jgi:hypothetical protein
VSQRLLVKEFVSLLLYLHNNLMNTAYFYTLKNVCVEYSKFVLICAHHTFHIHPFLKSLMR